MIPMKKSLLLLASLALLWGCGNKKPNNTTEPQPKPFSVDTYKVEDRHLLATVGEGEETYEEYASFNCEIDIPVTDNQALRDSICYWFAQNLGSIYDGAPSDVKAMVNFYKDWALETDDDYEEAEGFDLGYIITMQEATDHYVTYRFYDFIETSSSPRANAEETYVTFDRNTGKRFTRNMIKVDENLKQLVMNALFEQFFSDWEDDILPDLLFFDPEDEEDYGFFLPQYDDPWIYNDYVYFGYSEHEIADRCTGQPQCGLPYNVMEPYLTEEGKTYFNF